MTEKSALRRALKKLRSGYASGREGDARSRRLQERLLASRFWKECRRVAAYVSLESEAGTGLILEETLRSGRELFLPRCRSEGEEAGVMDLLHCAELGRLERSAYGILEPPYSSGAGRLEGRDLHKADTLILVPAIAFDRFGYRLGYGGGYYDRLLAAATCPSVGLTFHELLLPELPHDPWDRAVRGICTEEELLYL